MILQSELIDLISRDTDINKEIVRKIIRKYIKFIVIALENNENVRTSLGTFNVSMINQKEVHNFQTGKREKMFPKKKVAYHPSQLIIHSLDKINVKLYDEYERSLKEQDKNA